MAETFHITDIDSESLCAERERVLMLLRACVPPECVHEVGSTAVPGVVGKQDLDFLVRVSMQDFDGICAVLDQRFRRNADQLSNDTYQGYKVESDLDVAIQLTVEGGVNDDFLDFVRQLRASASLRAEYNELKQSFDGRSMDEYRAAKGAFIERALSRKRAS